MYCTRIGDMNGGCASIIISIHESRNFCNVCMSACIAAYVHTHALILNLIISIIIS